MSFVEHHNYVAGLAGVRCWKLFLQLKYHD
jgi:hypothetical protein